MTRPAASQPVRHAGSASTWAGGGQVLAFGLVVGALLLGALAVIAFISFAPRAPHGGVASFTGELSWFTLDNHLRSIDPLYLRIAWRSTWIALATTAACLLIGYPAAYWLAMRVPTRRRSVMLALIVLPFWTSFLVRTYAWMFILRAEGLVNTLLMNAGWIDTPLELLYHDGAVLLGLVYGELPFMILPIYACLEKLDRSLLEAADDLGAAGGACFRRVVWPLSLPGVAAGVVLVFVPSLGQFIVSDLLGGAKTVLVGNLIQNQFTAARDQPFGAALAMQLTAVVMAVLTAKVWFNRRQDAGRSAA